MTSKILIPTNKDNRLYMNLWIHDFHECDLIRFLKSNTRKKPLVSKNILDKISWFSLKLNQEDIKKIKKTSWFKNHIHDLENLEEEFIEGKEIEFILIK